MAQGEQAHAAHGELVAGYHRTRRLAYGLLLAALSGTMGAGPAFAPSAYR